VVVPAAVRAGLLLALVIRPMADPTLSLLGRDLTLSGRTRLWEVVLNEGLRRPYLGAGFRTFWIENGPGGPVMALVSRGNGNIGIGHNGYLDLWLELGLAGVMAYFVLLKEAAARIANLITQNDRLAVWLAVVVLHLSLYAVTERVLLDHSDPWVARLHGFPPTGNADARPSSQGRHLRAVEPVVSYGAPQRARVR
jgi:exopolysaccharide production protein ExoQ